MWWWTLYWECCLSTGQPAGPGCALAVLQTDRGGSACTGPCVAPSISTAPCCRPVCALSKLSKLRTANASSSLCPAEGSETLLLDCVILLWSRWAVCADDIVLLRSLPVSVHHHMRGPQYCVDWSKQSLCSNIYSGMKSPCPLPSETIGDDRRPVTTRLGRVVGILQHCAAR